MPKGAQQPGQRPDGSRAETCGSQLPSAPFPRVPHTHPRSGLRLCHLQARSVLVGSVHRWGLDCGALVPWGVLGGCLSMRGAPVAAGPPGLAAQRNQLRPSQHLQSTRTVEHGDLWGPEVRVWTLQPGGFPVAESTGRGWGTGGEGATSPTLRETRISHADWEPPTMVWHLGTR